MVTPNRTALIAAVLVMGCASAPSQRVYVAPTSETVFATAEELTSGPGQAVYVTNRSSVPVLIYSVSLRDCENIKGQCSVRPTNLHLDPNARVQIARIEPASPNKSFNFRYSFGWRADSAMTAALGALASNGDAHAQDQLEAVRRADNVRQHQVGAQDLNLAPDEIEALGPKVAGLRTTPDSIVLAKGQRVTADTVHVFLTGAGGEILGRVLSLQWRVVQGAVTIARPDTLVAQAPGRTALQLKLADGALSGRPDLHMLLQVPIIVK